MIGRLIFVSPLTDSCDVICLFPILHFSVIVVSLFFSILIMSVVIDDSVEKLALVMQDLSPILAVFSNISTGLLMIAPPGMKLVQPFPRFCRHSPSESSYFVVIVQSIFGDTKTLDNSLFSFIQN